MADIPIDQVIKAKTGPGDVRVTPPPNVTELTIIPDPNIPTLYVKIPGNLVVDSLDQNEFNSFNTGSPQGNGISFGRKSGEGIASFRGEGGNSLEFYSAFEERMRISNIGNVEIIKSLVVDSHNTNTGEFHPGSNFDNGISFGSGSGEGIGSNRQRPDKPNFQGLDFYTAFRRRLAIDNAGNLFGGDATNGLIPVKNGLAIDQADANNGGLPLFALSFGRNSGEGISSKRIGGEGQFGLDFYTAFKRRMRISQDGNVFVSKDIVLTNADCAEEFDIQENKDERITPGTVLIIGNDGKLLISMEEYDSRIAGVVSGAGSFRPALLLHRIESSDNPRMPIALIGKAFCKVDASFASIRSGDLLTTSQTPGHAMKAVDKTKAIGAILGKALQGLEKGLGMIPILVSPR
jgi:hypothetical protein